MSAAREHFLIVRVPSWRALAILLIPVTAALGPHFLPVGILGINIYAYRLLILGLLILSLLSTRKLVWMSTPVARFYMLLGCLWALWGLLSTFWAPDRNAATRDVLAVCFGFGTGVVLLNLKSYTTSGLNMLRRGWVLAYVVTAVIAVWEKLTGYHLPSSFTENAPGYVLSEIVISTFGNPNNYGAFLLLSLPFLLWSLSICRRGIHKALYLGLLLSLPVLIVFSASRVSIFGLAVQLLVYGLVNVRRKRSFLRFLSMVAVLALLVGWLLQSDVLILRKLALAFGDELQLGGSIAKRFNLLLNGLWFVYISAGLGIGAGGFIHMIPSGSAPWEAGYGLSPHNFWIEVLSQYGILVFLALVIWIVYLVHVAIRSRKAFMTKRDVTSLTIAEMILIGFVGYLFATVASSIYMVQSTNWMFLSSMVAMGTFVWNKRFREKML